MQMQRGDELHPTSTRLRHLGREKTQLPWSRSGKPAIRERVHARLAHVTPATMPPFIGRHRPLLLVAVGVDPSDANAPSTLKLLAGPLGVLTTTTPPRKLCSIASQHESLLRTASSRALSSQDEERGAYVLGDAKGERDD
jgi:hypothetical protein